MSPAASLRSAVVAVLVGGLVWACRGDDRIGECNRLIDAVGPHAEAVTRGVEALVRIEADPQAPARLASAVADAQTGLSALTLHDATLTQHLSAYREQLSAAKAVAEDIAAAARVRDPAALHEAVAHADRIVAQQDALLGQVNDYCSAPRR